jgi:putative ABC transport system permease protein
MVMEVLNKKLIRDLWKLRGQVLAVALVIGSGVATLVMSLSTIEALEDTTEAYYQRYRFGEIFAFATRAPLRLTNQISQINGVQTVQTRISSYANIDIQGFDQPAIAQLMSIPEKGQPLLNQLVLRKGGWVNPGRDDQVILNEPFAEAHQLDIGDTVSVIMNGHKKHFYVVGIALSPEFIYAIGPGALMPDDKLFGVMWMSYDVLAAAYDLQESFNYLSLTLTRNTLPADVLNNVDVLLEPYGGVRAIKREDQISNWFVKNEIEQQKSMATILPTIFITVAVFLTNMVLSRLIATQRTEIGLLKAFGYGNFQIAWHYIKMMLVIGIIGVTIGSVIGAYFGRLNTVMYAELFRFPLLIYRPSPFAFIISGLVSLIAAILGALTAVRTAVKLPPAEAMIPPSPGIYKQTFLSSLGLARLLDQPTRIALRQISRRPLRSFLTSAGIAMATGLIIMTLQWDDSLTHLKRVYFFDSQRQHITVGVVDSLPLRAIYDFEKLPGVLTAEPINAVNADFSFGSMTHRGGITGMQPDSTLQLIYDDGRKQSIDVPDSGIVIASRLARKLNIKIGDVMGVDVLEGRRPELLIPVVGIINSYIGLPTYMNLDTLNRALNESPSFKYANLLIDPRYQDELYAEFKNMPKVSTVMLKQSALDSFNEHLVEHLMVFISMFTGLAVVLVFGVTYNSTRVALSERGRELATLRVLGFTKGEISYVLLGEVMFLILLGLPLGCLFGGFLVWSMAQSFDTEMYRIPLVIEASTYGYAIVWVVIAAILSAALVRRRVNKLDLIRVLKTRE